MENELTAGLISRGDETEKIKTYMEVIEIFIQSAQMKGNKGIHKLGASMTRTGIRLVALAPDKVVNAYHRWRAVAAAGDDPEGTITAYANIILEIRNDMVPGTSLDIETILDAFA